MKLEYVAMGFRKQKRVFKTSESAWAFVDTHDDYTNVVEKRIEPPFDYVEDVIFALLNEQVLTEDDIFNGKVYQILSVQCLNTVNEMEFADVVKAVESVQKFIDKYVRVVKND